MGRFKSEKIPPIVVVLHSDANIFYRVVGSIFEKTHDQEGSVLDEIVAFREFKVGGKCYGDRGEEDQSDNPSGVLHGNPPGVGFTGGGLQKTCPCPKAGLRSEAGANN